MSKASEEQVNRDFIFAIRGHVDVGKTAFINAIRAHGREKEKKASKLLEAESITQQIATLTLPKSCVIKLLPPALKKEYRMDNITLIDTPGHADFGRLREISAKISHINLIFVDITSGMDEDTFEYLRDILLTGSEEETNKQCDKNIIVLNKIDKLYKYKQIGYGLIQNVFKKQSADTRSYIDAGYRRVIDKLAQIGIYSAPYYEKRTRDCVAMIPISSMTGDGIPDLMLYLSKCYLEMEQVTDNIGYIIDKRVDQNMGNILIGIMKYGSINRSNIMRINNSYFPVKRLFKNNTDSRQQNFELVDEIADANSFAIICDNNELIPIGSKFTAITEDMIECKVGGGGGGQIIDESLIEEVMNKKTRLLTEIGVHVIIPSESMIDGIHDFFTKEKIPISNYSLRLSKKDLFILNNKIDRDEHKYAERYRCVMVCIPDLMEEKKKDVLAREIFSEEILEIMHTEKVHLIFAGTIYKLAGQYKEFLKKCRQDFLLQRNYKSYSYFQADIINKFIFRVSGPIICGVKVTDGTIAVDSIVIDADNNNIGIVTSIQLDNKPIQFATSGMDVCLKIEEGTHTLDKKKNYRFSNGPGLVDHMSRLVALDLASK